MKKIFYIFILIVLSCYVYSLLSCRSFSVIADTIDASVVKMGISEKWLGVFLNSQKIGFSFTRIERDEFDFILENFTQITFSVGVVVNIPIIS